MLDVRIATHLGQKLSGATHSASIPSPLVIMTFQHSRRGCIVGISLESYLDHPNRCTEVVGLLNRRGPCREELSSTISRTRQWRVRAGQDTWRGCPATLEYRSARRERDRLFVLAYASSSRSSYPCAKRTGSSMSRPDPRVGDSVQQVGA